MNENTPINFEKAFMRFDEDREFLMEVLDGFMANVKVQIISIRRAILDGNADLVMREAHAIKGGAANLTADRLSESASELERIGHSGALDGAEEVVEILEKEFKSLEIYLEDL